jgi:hypothetical protein
MPKRCDELFQRIANFGALRSTGRRAVRGTGKKPGASAFFANLERELLRLERELEDGPHRPVTGVSGWLQAVRGDPVGFGSLFIGKL